MHFFFKEYNLNDSYAGFWWSCRDRGESDKRCFCGLISAILAKSPAIIMVGNLFDLSSSFCMFGFYLIMFYSNPLLRTFCLACLCHCIKNNDKKKTLHRLSKWHFYPFWFSFDSLLLPPLRNCKATPWGDGASVALVEKLVPRAAIHIYKHAIPFSFIKFYFVRLRENTLTTQKHTIFRFQGQSEEKKKTPTALCEAPPYTSTGMIPDYQD